MNSSKSSDSPDPRRKDAGGKEHKSHKRKKSKRKVPFARMRHISTDVSNREISFLLFNERVRELAADETVPLLERLRFLCISSNNLDEFFEVRVAGIKQKIQGGVEGAGVDGLSPQQELNLITENVHRLVESQYKLLSKSLVPEMAKQGIKIFARDEWTPELSEWVKTYFNREIVSILSPLGLDTSHPFPRLTNKSLNFIIDLDGVDAFGRDPGYALLRAPSSLPSLIRVPQEIGGVEYGFVFLTSMMHSQMGSLFAGMNPVGVYQFKVTRNSELYVFEEEVANLRRALEEELLQRNFGRAVRLEISDSCPGKIVKFLLDQFRLDDDDMYPISGPIDLNRLSELPDLIDKPELKYPAFSPSALSNYDGSFDIFERIKSRGPILFHHPYESYLPVIELIRQAARDPDVLAIKQTLYRTGNESAFVDYLMEAGRAGKDVTVVIELRARFDEAANIQLATRLQEAGIQVVYGVVGFKTHAKMLLVVRREKNKLVKYAHMGTGNYHATTARAYTDLSLLTNDEKITRDVRRIFTQLTGLGKAINLNSIVQAPFSLHDFVLENIHNERKVSEEGGAGVIVARMNSLVDAAVIDAMYKASQAGVKIDLIVRGICILKPGVPGLSENIRVVSVLGRFLEHSRVFYFGNRGKANLYLSSADWMPRNFFSRVEIAVPLQGKVAARAKEECLDFYFKDNLFAWELQSDGRYVRKTPGSKVPFSAQGALIERFGADAAQS